MKRLLWLAVAIAVIFFVILALTLEHDTCPEGQTWVMSDKKWICVDKGGS
jgi:hypothetical protein